MSSSCQTTRICASVTSMGSLHGQSRRYNYLPRGPQCWNVKRKYWPCSPAGHGSPMCSSYCVDMAGGSWEIQWRSRNLLSLCCKLCGRKLCGESFIHKPMMLYSLSLTGDKTKIEPAPSPAKAAVVFDCDRIRSWIQRQDRVGTAVFSNQFWIPIRTVSYLNWNQTRLNVVCYAIMKQ